MAVHSLFAYVDGSDLEELAENLEQYFDDFVASRRWVCDGVRVVNQRHPRDESMKPDDLADWDLGLNMDLPDPPQEPRGWFGDVEAIANFLADLHTKTGRDFVIGIWDSLREYSEDLFYIDSDKPDLAELRAIIGVKDNG